MDVVLKQNGNRNIALIFSSLLFFGWVCQSYKDTSLIKIHLLMLIKFYKVYPFCFRDNVRIIQCSWLVYCCPGSPGIGCILGIAISQWTHSHWNSGWQWRWSYSCYSCSKLGILFSVQHWKCHTYSFSCLHNIVLCNYVEIQINYTHCRSLVKEIYEIFAVGD